MDQILALTALALVNSIIMFMCSSPENYHYFQVLAALSSLFALIAIALRVKKS